MASEIPAPDQARQVRVILGLPPAGHVLRERLGFCLSP